MNYIYYIWLSNNKNIDLSTERAGNYIGQGSAGLDKGKLYGRMLEHLQIAYGSKTKKPYGSELLIREVGASDVFFGVFHAPNYGLNPQIFVEMQKDGWNISNADDAARLDAAEILHIISHKGDLSGGNIATGGQGSLIWTPNNIDWVKRFKENWSTEKLYKGDIQSVKVNFHDSLEVALTKLWYPDQFIVVRAASLAIEASILNDSKFLTDVIIAYVNSENEAKRLIEQKVTDTINKLNTVVFQDNKVKPEHIGALISIVEEKVLKWAAERIYAVSVSKTIQDLNEIFDPHNELHLKWAVHGLPNYISHPKDNNKVPNTVVAKTSFHIRRSEWVSAIKGVKPKWYKMLMSSPAKVPEINTGRDDGLRKIVEDCIYQIFLYHMKRCIKTNEPKKPKTSLKERIRDKYIAAGAHMKNYSVFYQYAIGKWEAENNRSLTMIDGSTEEDRNLYTFEPDLTPTTWKYSWSDSFADKILLHYGADEIPSWTW